MLSVDRNEEKEECPSLPRGCTQVARAQCSNEEDGGFMVGVREATTRYSQSPWLLSSPSFLDQVLVSKGLFGQEGFKREKDCNMGSGDIRGIVVPETQMTNFSNGGAV